ncbi:CoA transferase [Mycobacterium sp.]|uniref:CoA transferase n=1 Tax=Mycobacterium sp. TaxID=1785 RepID=UPI0031DE0100
MDAAADWAGSGLAWLTGPPDGPPDFSRAAVLAEARRVCRDIAALTGVHADAATVLAGRAAILGLTRRGRVSAGGATLLLATGDGWCALALPRAEDVAALPALLRADAVTDPWCALTHWAATHSVDEVVTRAGLLDIAVAALGEAGPAEPAVRRAGGAAEPRGVDGLLVVDLSSLWAGPLCTRLLARAGAVVVKVESPSRPDGTRSGKPEFFDWMNSGKLCYATDFGADADTLRELLAAADVVVEGSRPAALRRRGLGSADVPARRGRVWLRIGGHADAPDRPAFGDDAALAGGLVGAGPDGPVFCGDAIADPLAGLEAARAVAQSLRRGGGEVIDVSLAQVAARYAALPRAAPVSGRPSAAPRPPPPSAPASAMGADNVVVRRIVSERLSAPC